MVINQNLATVSVYQLDNMFEQQAFAGTGRAYDRKGLARFDVQVDVFEDMIVTERLVEILDLDTHTIRALVTDLTNVIADDVSCKTVCKLGPERSDRGQSKIPYIIKRVRR